MLEITRFETNSRINSILTVSAFTIAMSWLTIWLYPSIKQSGFDFQEYIEELPDELMALMGGSLTDFGTIEGFLTIEVYQWLWVLILGGYFAYLSASIISGDIEKGTADLILSTAISRTRYVRGKYISLIPVIAGIGLINMLGIYTGVIIIGEYIPLHRLIVLHFSLAVYHVCCAAVGLVPSVVFDDQRRAQMVGAGVIFAMFIVDGVTLDTDYEWIGDFTLPRYIDIATILMNGELEPFNLTLLLITSIVLVILCTKYFERKDIPN